MTGSFRPTVPQDFSIQVAENEGMPSRPYIEEHSPTVVRSGRKTGTLRPRKSKASMKPDGSRLGKTEMMKRDKMLAGHPFTRLHAKLAIVASVVASFAFPVLAQDVTGSKPDNALLCLQQEACEQSHPT